MGRGDSAGKDPQGLFSESVEKPLESLLEERYDLIYTLKVHSGCYVKDGHRRGKRRPSWSSRWVRGGGNWDLG